jgi:hypothetical protein
LILILPSALTLSLLGLLTLSTSLTLLSLSPALGTTLPLHRYRRLRDESHQTDGQNNDDYRYN